MFNFFLGALMIISSMDLDASNCTTCRSDLGYSFYFFLSNPHSYRKILTHSENGNVFGITKSAVGGEILGLGWKIYRE